MIKQKEIASLIQKGLETGNVTESENCFFEDVSGKFSMSALLGRLWWAKTAYEPVESEKEVYVQLAGIGLALSLGYVDIAANLLDIDFDLADAVDRTHMLGVPAIAIIEKLGQESFPY
jgi:hypothetical protein